MASYRLDIYSHHFRVSGYSAQGKYHLVVYCTQRLGQMEVFRKYDGSFEKKLERIFAATRKDRQEYRFHINCLNDFKAFLKNRGYNDNDFEIVEHALYQPAHADIHDVSGMTPRDYQPPIIDYIVQDDHPSKLVIIQMGKGKAQPLDSLVKVPHGWKRMGDIQVGDVVTAKDGTPTSVLGVFPQGTKEIFQVHFADGRIVECCDEHLWKVYKPSRVWDRKIVNTREMIRMLSLADNRLYVDLCDSEDCPDVDLPMDPYVLGLLIGDGHTGERTVRYSSADDELVSAISSVLPDGHDLAQLSSNKYDHQITTRKRGGENEFLTTMRELGLAGKKSYHKFIPDLYMKGSTKQRLAMVQGLMDTDGTVQRESGSVSFTSTSILLAKQVQQLIWSLGGIATLRARRPFYTHNGERREGAPAFDVDIRYKKPSELFRLKRKIELTNDNNQYAKHLKLRVEFIKSIGFKEAQCISIAHPEHLYVTDGHVVTHNTFCSLQAAVQMQQRGLIVLKGMYVDRWMNDLREAKKAGESSILGLKPGELLLVRGSADLKKLFAMALNGELKAKIIVMTNKTLYNYIDHYETFNGVEGEYQFPPDQMCEKLGLGWRLIDEVHQDFHLNFRLDLYTHCPKVIALSATMTHDKPFINRMYNIAYPKEHRFGGIAYDRYVDVIELVYYLNMPTKLKWLQRGMRSYNHVAYEESIMKHKDSMRHYLNMILRIVQESFLSKFEVGQKLLIYVATVTFAEVLTKALRDMVKDADLKINKYTAEDEYLQLITSDISVSTLLSAGTAVDIPNLRVVLMTTALSSTQANLQAFGRLRPLKQWPDVTPEFIYLTCQSIDKHSEYALKKKEVLKDIALTQRSLMLDDCI